MTIADRARRTAHLALLAEFTRLADIVFRDVAAFMPVELPDADGRDLIDLPA